MALKSPPPPSPHSPLSLPPSLVLPRPTDGEPDNTIAIVAAILGVLAFVLVLVFVALLIFAFK